MINSSRNPSKKGKNVGFDAEVNEKEKAKEVARRKAIKAAKQAALENTKPGTRKEYVSRRGKQFEDSQSDVEHDD